MNIFGTDCIDNDLNCSNFTTRADAQAKYDMCADKIAQDNKSSKESVKSLDIYGLDKDKDGVVCEALK
jgi:hypothetical protein